MADARLARVDELLRSGDPTAARALSNAILDDPQSSMHDRRTAMVLRSHAHEDLRDLASAIADLRAALAIEARDARTHNALGILLADAGSDEEAAAAFRRATSLDPNYARAWNNLGNALRATGRLEESRDAFERAVAVQPDYPLAWSNLGTVQRDLGQLAAAEASLRRSLQLKTDHQPGLTVLAGLVRRQGRIDEAQALLTHAAAAAPRDTAILFQLAGVLAEKDELASARSVYRNIRRLDPASLRAAFGERLVLPMVCGRADEPAQARKVYADGLAELAREVTLLASGRAFANVLDDLRWTNFLLAYQGEDDRSLQESYARIAGAAIETADGGWRAPIPPRTQPSERIRVGFVSSFLHDGTVGRYFQSWIADLDRTVFEVWVFVTRTSRDPIVDAIAQRADRFVPLSGRDALPSRLAGRILAAKLDALIYPELGMDETTFALAGLRLAPFQATAWGHPVTTGHSTIDAFFTSDAMEPPDADSHYSERLVRLPGIGTRYVMPRARTNRSRVAFGLPDDAMLFLCPQSLFKIHPENDALFAQVFAAAPSARLVAFEGRHAALTEKFRRRLGGTFETMGLRLDQYLIMVPQCGHDDYLRLNSLCDAMLDTLRWSGGNASLDALSSGLPIVTLPGRFMRGRQSAGMLSLLGIDELIARDGDDYVRIAARLASDGTWRGAMRTRITERMPVLFDDPAPTRALAEALLANTRGATP